jgi:hypothetical protein
MSTYVREKVLRIPMDKIDFSLIKSGIKERFPEEDDEDIEDDFSYYLEKAFPELFDYATIGKFQMSPTESPFLDYLIDYEYDADGEYGKTRALYETEKEKYRSIFQKVDPNIDMNLVRLVEFCWYNCTEAKDYYNETNDSFYDEI